MDRWLMSVLLLAALYFFSVLGKEITSRDIPRQSPPNRTLQLVESINVSLDSTFQGLSNISHNVTLQEIYEDNARLAWEDAIVDKALVVIGIGAGVVIVLGLGYYAKMGYCTSDP